MRPTSFRHDPRAVAALAVGALGAVDLLAGAFAPRLAPALFLPLNRLGGATAALTCGVALMLLARGLSRGLRAAWLVAILLLGQATLASPVHHDELALLPLVPLAFLLRQNAHFTVHVRTPRRAYAALVAAFLLGGAAGSTTPARHARPVFVHVVRAEEPETRALEIHTTVHHAAAAHATANGPLVLLTIAILLVLLWSLCGLTLPALPRRSSEGRRRARARRLFAEAGANPVGYFAGVGNMDLWEDPAHRGIVAYRVIGATALVVGDPIAPPDDLAAVLDGFLGHCRAHGWTPAFYQALPATLPLYRARGFCAFAVGREAIIDLPAFTLAGKRIANVRHAVTHAERAGLRVQLYGADALDAPTRAALLDISQEWLAGKGSGEMGFTMGQLAPDGSPTPDARVAVAYDAEGRAQAFITVIPSGGGRGWTLDLMRRRRTAESGAMDLLIARTAEALRDEGYATFSLSLAPLAGGEGDDEDAPALARRARTMLYEKMDGAYNYRSLYAFKRKFAVRWEARYLVYAGRAALLPALYATARAHMPSTLITLPHLPGRIRRSGAGTARPLDRERRIA